VAYANHKAIGGASSANGADTACLFKWTDFFPRKANTGFLTGLRLFGSAAG
jgi:hypothetical protein